MTDDEYSTFLKKHTKAKQELVDREAKVQKARLFILSPSFSCSDSAQTIEEIETGLELIGLSGVEDKLQEKVKPTLEMLRNAGIKESPSPLLPRSSLSASIPHSS